MRWFPLLLPALLLTGCDQIPGLRNILHKAKRIERQSDRTDVDCDMKKGRGPRDGCVTKSIACGDSIQGNTTGGRAKFEDEFYVAKYCVPSHNGYHGNERVYTLDLPPNTGANIFLDTDCADLDLFAFRWPYDGKCPTASHTISECEADDDEGDGIVHVETVKNPGAYMIVVEGKAGVEAPFHLTVECGQSR
jgi:hypothetical protein